MKNNDDEVIVITDSEDDVTVSPGKKTTDGASAETELDAGSILKFFRLGPKKLAYVEFLPPFIIGC